MVIRPYRESDRSWAESLLERVWRPFAGPARGTDRRACTAGIHGRARRPAYRPRDLSTRERRVRTSVHCGTRATDGIGSALLDALRHEIGDGERIWLVTTNDNLEALRFYQRRGFRLSALRTGAVDESRRRLKPQIPTVGDFGIPIRDEIELEYGRSTRALPPGSALRPKSAAFRHNLGTFSASGAGRIRTYVRYAGGDGRPGA